MNSNLAVSGWGSARPLTIIFLTVTTAWFLIALFLDVSWRLGWVLLLVSYLSEMFQSLHDLRKRFYVFDAPLFSVGMLFFTVLDPLFAIGAGTAFPGVNNEFHFGNLIGNKAGLLVATFSLCFYLGRLVVKSPNIQDWNIQFNKKALKITLLPILLGATAISLFSVLANGGGFSLKNVLWSITARSRGYVAFSTSGLGTDNPIVALFGQCIPTAIILWLLSVKKHRPMWSFFAVVIALLLFSLYTLLGGRSGIIFVALTIIIYYIVTLKLRLKASQILILSLVLFSVLAIQTNFRDQGKFGESFFEHSPFRGFALNRELAFIVDTYGTKEDFIRGPGTIQRIVMPLPDTVGVFLTNPIPRKIWPSKPVDPSFGPYNELRTGKTGFGASSNITPTIPGRYYINYGFLGVIQIGILFGILWRFFDRVLISKKSFNKNTILIAAMLNAIMFISLRDFTFGKFYPFLFLLLFLYITKFFRERASV